MELRRQLILASSSPRRQFLMREIGFQYVVQKPDVDEVFPSTLPVREVARYLAAMKVDFFRHQAGDNIILTADTVVILGNRILNKPCDRREAIAMLSALSGNTHRVMTGVSILSADREINFDVSTDVTFEKLTLSDIEFYIDHFQPYDKAGSYGAQDCLPADMNPCSEEEMQFLKSIDKENLMDKMLNEKPPSDRIVIIKDISGSYFNVMGLPVHKVYDQLKYWLA